MAVDVRWLGHSAFHLSGGGADVLVDPFLTGNPKAAATADEVPADVILLTHGHGDHLGDTVDDRQAHRRDGAWRSSSSRPRSRATASRTSSNPNYGGTVTFDWGWVKLVPAWHTAVSPSGTAHMPAGLLIHYGGHLIYHLGDTALFSDLQLIARRGDKVDLALVPIGGHYTMDRYDAVTAVEFINPSQVIPIHYGTFPPSRPTPQAFKQDVQNAGFSRGARARPRRHAHAEMTHAVVLIEAEREAIADARRPARRRRGRRRGLLRHRRVGLRGDPAGAQPGGGRAGRHAPLRRASRASSARSTMVAFEVFSQHDLEALFSIGN